MSVRSLSTSESRNPSLGALGDVLRARFSDLSLLTRSRIGFGIVCVAIIPILASCERPLVEDEEPTLEIVEPNFDNIFQNPSISVAVRTNAFEAVSSVTLDGQPLTFDVALGVWTARTELRMGLNRLVFSVINADGEAVHDTTYAYHILPQITSLGPILPDDRGGHTATLLADGRVLVTGGAARTDAPVRADAAILPRGGARFRDADGRLHEARAGHSASLLPDGRVLIVGGTKSFTVNDVGDLVESVEVYDPGTDEFSPVPVVGAPIRRAFHTAHFRIAEGEWIVDLFGGTGDVQYDPTPLLGIRSDLRSFRYRNDSLFALNPAPGPSLGVPLTGHTLTPLQENGAAEGSLFLLLGAIFEPGDEENISAILNYAAPQGLVIRSTGRMMVPRTAHAAALLGPRVVVVFGGHQGSQASVLPDIEFYVADAGQFFYYPLNAVVQSRFGHTATKLSPQRILVSGGFSPTGEGLSQSDVFSVPSL